MPAQKKQHEEVLNAGKFVLFLVVAFAALSLLVFLFPPLFFEKLTVQTSSGILNVLGIKNEIEMEELALIQLQNEEKTTIIINELCTGILEALVLVSAILATFEFSWKKRATGAVAAVLAIFVFNQIRIVSTIFFILKAPLDLVVLSHDIFFRIFLFVTIAVFYWLFLRWGKKYPRAKNK